MNNFEYPFVCVNMVDFGMGYNRNVYFDLYTTYNFVVCDFPFIASLSFCNFILCTKPPTTFVIKIHKNLIIEMQNMVSKHPKMEGSS
jgi:hypothetical protein